ncbi:MAG: tRNA (N(6)-L-threonylcarbamoyladenosine(37)-C(2))-methylthiotransferase MtaB [Clostridia bacterium]|nr:tRNA (N(6)-L-threonylcarbamoyladenosine(37)-C(2))-methylthiotransferase MtaB [Clostridia bacterium]
MKVAFYTLGCKVNQYETDFMQKKFVDDGNNIVDFNEKADIYIVNSCSVTNLSTRKTRQALSKAKRNGGIVVLAGCYAQEIKEETKIENVDVVIGNEEKQDIVSIVKEYLARNHKAKNEVTFKISDIACVKKYTQKEGLEKGINVRESVKIEDGCNNFCSYCIIPYVRGRVRSRNLEDIVAEVKSLVKSGVGEVVLVGIEIASYGKDFSTGTSLIDVIEEVNKIEGLKRIRLGSIEPRILTDDFILRLANVDKLCPHFHLSVQSLDNNVLKRMNRKYTREDIFHITDKLRGNIKDVAFTCDIIVGFPGETEEEFHTTIDGIKKVQFYEVHTFKYSKRKWTKAAIMPEQVEGTIASDRSNQVIRLARELKHRYMSQYIGSTMEVLVESYDKEFLYGYTSNYIKVKVRGDKGKWGYLLKTELNSIEEDMILGNILR